MNPALRFRDCVVQILRPHLGADVARERANNLAQLWALEGELSEGDASALIRQARLDCYGAVAVSDVEADSLAARVMLLLDGLS